MEITKNMTDKIEDIKKTSLNHDLHDETLISLLKESSFITPEVSKALEELEMHETEHLNKKD